MLKDTTQETGMRSGAETANKRRLGARRRAGFTLIELLVVIAVMVIMATWAVPNYQQFVARNEVAAEVMRIRTALALARNAAVTRRVTVSVCPSRNQQNCTSDWTEPLVVILGNGSEAITSDSLLKVLDESQVDSVTFRKDNQPVSYGALGRSVGHNGTFRICDRLGTGAQVIVSNFGRVRVNPERSSCPEE